MIPWLLIAELVSTRGLSLAELVEDRMRAFPCSGEINFKVAEARAATERVMSRYASQSPALDHTDGISADFGAWRFNLRSSNTEPLLRLNVESRGDVALMQECMGEISALIAGA
jgi:phosphomannomutase/phosphoglucomutase